MTQRILVLGELSPWFHVGRLAAVLALAGGLAIGAVGPAWGFALTAAAGLAALVLEFQAWQARRIRTWLTLHPDGFELESRAGHRAIHDSQVAAIALDTKKNLANGQLTSVTRKLVLWIQDEPSPIRAQNKIKVGMSDPLAGLIDRLMARLVARFERDLAQGGTASGDGWHLSRTALTVGRPPADEQIPLTAITGVEPFDGQMCIWRSGQDVAAARLPLSGRNVHLLPSLVGPYLDAATQRDSAAAPSAGLGRVLFERRAHRGTVLAATIAGVMLAASGAALLAAWWGRQNADDGLFIVSGILLAIGPLLAAAGWWLAGANFRCHERGVWKASRFGQKTLRYDEVGSFQYSVTRHYHNGAYVGTTLAMCFSPAAGEARQKLKFNARIRGEDDDLERLRDMISQRIAARMLAQFHAEQPVPWTANLQFLPDGLWYRPAGFVGRKQAKLLAYADYGGFDLKDGSLYLFARGEKKAVMTESCAADNFYPGYFLLLAVLHQPAESPADQPAPQ